MGRWKTRVIFIVVLLAAVAVVGAVAVFVFRPAKFVGVDEQPLVNSIGSTSSVYEQSCQAQAQTWDCRLYLGGTGGGTTRMTVTVEDNGCWDAWSGRPTKAKTDKPPERSGCISVFDLF